MHRTALLTLFVVSLATAGCGSLSDATHMVRDRIAGRDEARVRTFDAPQSATYDAIRAAATEMGYRFVRGGAARGQFEAVSGLGRGEATGTARQLVLKAQLEPNPEGGTQVTVRITEVIEADSSNRPGVATETPLRDTPQYQVFFRTVDEALESAR
jgi:hypothetical protein